MYAHTNTHTMCLSATDWVYQFVNLKYHITTSVCGIRKQISIMFSDIKMWDICLCSNYPCRHTSLFAQRNS